MVARLLDRLFPGTCPGCGALSAERICARCWGARPTLPAGACPRCSGRWPCRDCPVGAGRVAAVLALGPYRGLWERSLRLLKYHGRTDLARPLGRALADLADRVWPDLAGAALVPVPAPGSRRRARGYDHAELLARAASGAAGMRLAAGALRRVRDTPPLHGAGPAERAASLAGAFTAAPTAGSIVLVDDILTTGATARAAAEALRAAGADEVRILVVARA